MDVLAALGDAPTALIAVVAILLGVVFAVRGQRGERGTVAGAADVAAPTLLKLPVATAEPEPDADAEGLRTMAVGEVGHGAIRLGRPEAEADPPPAAPAEPEAVEPPAPASQPPPAPGIAPFHQGPIKLRDPGDG